jgi:hypothetical protein
MFIVIIGVAFLTPQDNSVKNIPEMNIPEMNIPETKPVPPDNVLNIIGADGHRIILANNLSARDPSYEELKTFLKADKTDQIPYNYSSFVCADFAETVHNNAEQAGIKAGYVHIAFNEINDTHACNVFNTTDRGLILIDCTNSLGGQGPSNNDRIVTIKEGNTYYPHYLFASGRWRTLPMGTVKSYEIFW